jgi:phage terminase large subunit
VGVQRIVIPYVPRAQFTAYHYTPKRWRVIVAHRRAGKTVATINELIRTALTCKLTEPRCAYIAPLYRQAKDVAWTYLKRFSAPIPGVEVNESELRVDYPNGGRVRLYGADNPDALRGVYLDDCVLDEYADMRPRVLPEIIRPALSDRKGSLTLIGTPRGHNAFYDAWRLAQGDPDWFAVMLRASETGLVDAEELAGARKLMSPEQYEQEFECSFEAAIQGSYWGREMAAAEREGRICDLPYDPGLPVHTAWDLGVGDATAIWFFQVLHGGVNVIDFYMTTGQGVEHYADVLRKRDYRYGQHYVPHDARVREWGSGRTRIEAMMACKLIPTLLVQHTLEDGIDAARRTIPLCRFDRKKCDDRPDPSQSKSGLEALKQYRKEYDEEHGVFRDKPLHDWASDPADAFRYLSMAWRAMRPEPPPPPKPVFSYSVGEDGSIRSGMTFNEMVKRMDRKFAED